MLPRVKSIPKGWTRKPSHKVATSAGEKMLYEVSPNLLATFGVHVDDLNKCGDYSKPYISIILRLLIKLKLSKPLLLRLRLKPTKTTPTTTAPLVPLFESQRLPKPTGVSFVFHGTQFV